MHKRATLLVFTIVLAACTGGPVLTELPTNHPANPDAAPAPLPPPSETLAIDGEAPMAPALPEKPQGPVVYACPMHPEVTSDQPGQTCPKCGMELVPRHETGDHT